MTSPCMAILGPDPRDPDRHTADMSPAAITAAFLAGHFRLPPGPKRERAYRALTPDERALVNAERAACSEALREIVARVMERARERQAAAQPPFAVIGGER